MQARFKTKLLVAIKKQQQHLLSVIFAALIFAFKIFDEKGHNSFCNSCCCCCRRRCRCCWCWCCCWPVDPQPTKNCAIDSKQSNVFATGDEKKEKKVSFKCRRALIFGYRACAPTNDGTPIMLQLSQLFRHRPLSRALSLSQSVWWFRRWEPQPPSSWNASRKFWRPRSGPFAKPAKQAAKIGSSLYIVQRLLVHALIRVCVCACGCVCASVGACVRKCCMCTRGPFAKNILRPVSRAGMQISQPAPSHTILSLLTHPYTHSLTRTHSHTLTRTHTHSHALTHTNQVMACQCNIRKWISTFSKSQLPG